MDWLIKVFGANWKTTVAGLATILGALADILHGVSAGSKVDWQVDGAAIVAGIGLIAAKDSTTHSTTDQVEAATEKATSPKP